MLGVQEYAAGAILIQRHRHSSHELRYLRYHLPVTHIYIYAFSASNQFGNSLIAIREENNLISRMELHSCIK